MTKKRLFSVILAGFWALSLAPGTSHGAAGPWWNTDHGKVRLIAAGNTTGISSGNLGANSGGILGGQAGKIKLGLQFQMLPGWKIYWRSPGDAGFPPRPSWAGSKNVAAIQIDWPTPVRFSVTGLETLGYKNEVVLPLEVEPFEPGKPVSIRAQVPYLTCEEICVPYDARLTLDLPAGPESNSPETALIDRFAAQVPIKGANASLSVAVAEVDGAPGKQQLRVVASAAQPFTNPDLLIEGPAGFRFGKPRVQKLEANGTAGRAVLLASVSPPPKSVRNGTPTNLVGANLVLTMIDGSRAVEQRLDVRQGQAAPMPSAAPGPPPVSVAGFLAILGLALIGGLILNLMPCVLPVLSLKLLSVVGHGGGDRRDVRRGFLASAAGIVVSFLVLGSVAVALKASGQAVGWGIQFQNPLFLTATAVIVALFAANLWGLFEIRLPGAVANAAFTAGQGGRHGLAKHFMTGAFATLLATPCSAPFLGTAVGFALARGPFEIYAIFAMLGIGLALPYLLIAWQPWLATRLPRPGQWMVTLRRVLGLALAATAIWLLSVLDAQAGRTAALLGGVLIGGLVAVLWIGRIATNASPKAIWGAATIVAVLGILLPPQFAQEGAIEREVVQGTIRWQKFAPEAIAGHVAVGRTVFVDVTADWCVTCKVNKVLVLDHGPVAARLNGTGIIAMQADWTRPDPKITAFLQRFMRYGIPFNVVFGPKAPEGRALPELLTRDAVLSALDAATSKAVAEK